MLGLACCTFSSVICKATLVRAEIQPDNTLGGEATVLTPGVEVKGATADIINGGAVRGANLFHSFREFSIGDGQRIYFANPTGVENILTRVTGNNRSEILGTLGILGNANLFFINPNGIVFGQNARLDVGGSFVASTADSLLFDNGFAFSANNPQSVPLLTINVPLGLQFGGNSGNIQVQRSMLRIRDGETFALVAGNVSLDGAKLQTLEGQIEIGGVKSGTVGLKTVGDNFSFHFADANRGDILLNNRSSIDVMAFGGGEIAIAAENIDILQGSTLLAGTRATAVTPQTTVKDVVLNATGVIRLDGQDSLIQNGVFRQTVGNAGNINITARSLFVSNGALIVATNSGQGSVGGINIKTTDTVAIDGASATGIVSTIGVQLSIGGIGKTGDFTLATRALSVTNGAQLGTSTFGQGDAGNITITAQTVSVDGMMQTASRRFSSGITSSVAPRSVGKGGTIQIDTELLSITNSGRLFSSTFGEGRAGDIVVNAIDRVVLDGTGTTNFPSAMVSQVASPGIGDGGNINITARSLALTNGAQLAASSFGRGNAGNVRVNVGDTLILDGVNRNNIPSGIFSSLEQRGVGRGGDIEIGARALSIANEAGLFASTIGRGDSGRVFVQATDTVTLTNGGRILVTVQPNAVGNSRDIEVETRSLQVTDSAQINASSQGTGIGGNIRIRADSLTLDRQGEISAETASNTGGNITLDVPRLFLLRRGGNLSTTAGTAQAGGDGGNIAIAAGLIVASPTEDSNITADAFTGKGGNIDIKAQGIFGIKFRDRQTAFSDITASSQLGINGVVEINTPDVDPSNGLVNLPTNLVDASQQITQSCRDSTGAIANQKSEFIITGRGGLPANPSEILSSDAVWEDLQPHALLNEKLSNSQPQQKTLAQPPTAIVEAQGWEIAANGIVTLVAQAPATTPHNSFVKPVSCPVVQN
ncbi:two-partner secretion domain-containing protein [Calothrix parietina]|uniref:two-partner secretion domain-containing protein n=1 Tax=Calothrix parietina TaxID=32054 RepID=UPI001A7EDCA2|nr:S-layer family protein [Calothrix parietina]